MFGFVKIGYDYKCFCKLKSVVFNAKVGVWARAVDGYGAESKLESELVCADFSKEKGKAHITLCLSLL